MFKVCSKCKIEKRLVDFHKDLRKKNGCCSTCKICARKRRKQHYKKNRLLTLQKNQQYVLKNKDKVLEYKKQWMHKNSKRISQNRSKRKKEDINYKLSCNLRSRLSRALKEERKSGSSVKDLGCSIAELKIYLEKQFKLGMSWDNYGFYGWHVDHIKPLVSFDLTDKEQFLEACHYTNLQPLWAKENLSKGGIKND